MATAKSDKLTLAAVVGAGAVLGAGVVLGASGIYMYHKLNTNVTLEINHLSNTIGVLVKEIEELKCLTSTKKSKSKRNAVSSRNSVGTASSGDEEFYDFTDEENLPFNVSGSTVTEVCDRADRLLDGNSDEKESAYRLLLREYDKYSNEAEYLWRLIKATHLRSVNVGFHGDYEQKKKLSFEAKQYATKALNLGSESSEIHKWYAIALGSAGEFLSLQERIKDGFTFKEHVVKAVQLSPNDSTLHHMLGRWCYEVYMLPWIERKVAATLFSAPPESTAEEARDHFSRAEELHQCPWKENKLFIAKTFIGAGEYSQALPWLDEAYALPVVSDDDDIAHKEIEALLSKYSGYRP